MRLPVDQRFHEERRFHDFRFSCEDCAFLVARTGLCAHEWPNAAHRAAASAGEPREIVLCKEFEPA
ncbi:MAG: hypothetical protein AABZ30_00470 [Myxococcota bacterium]